MASCLLRAFSLLIQMLLIPAVLLLSTNAVLASTVALAPGLEVSLPTSLVLEVIESPQQQLPVQHSSAIIAGEISGEPGYFIAASKTKSWEKNIVLWKKLEAEMRKRSNTDITKGAKGSFITDARDAVWFRVYEYRLLDQTHRQIYFLLKNEHSVYWITMTVTENVSIDLAIPIAKAIIRHARIAD